jgi:hypothetical protein
LPKSSSGPISDADSTLQSLFDSLGIPSTQFNLVCGALGPAAVFADALAQPSASDAGVFPDQLMMLPGPQTTGLSLEDENGAMEAFSCGLLPAASAAVLPPIFATTPTSSAPPTVSAAAGDSRSHAGLPLHMSLNSTGTTTGGVLTSGFASPSPSEDSSGSSPAPSPAPSSGRVVKSGRRQDVGPTEERHAAQKVGPSLCLRGASAVTVTGCRQDAGSRSRAKLRKVFRDLILAVPPLREAHHQPTRAEVLQVTSEFIEQAVQANARLAKQAQEVCLP